MVCTCENLSHFCKNSPQVIDRMLWTFYSTHSATQTYGFLDHCTVVFYMDRTGSTGFFTDAAADAADRTDSSGIFAFIFVGAFNNNGIGTVM